MRPELITIISSGLSGLLAVVVCLINNRYQNNKTLALLDYRLQALERKVDRHNNMIERTYELEKKAEVHEEQIKVANHRIDDLERGGGK